MSHSSNGPSSSSSGGQSSSGILSYLLQQPPQLISDRRHVHPHPTPVLRRPADALPLYRQLATTLPIGVIEPMSRRHQSISQFMVSSSSSSSSSCPVTPVAHLLPVMPSFRSFESPSVSHPERQQQWCLYPGCTPCSHHGSHAADYRRVHCNYKQVSVTPKSSHSQNPSFICHVCKVAFYFRTGLKRHIEDAHTDSGHESQKHLIQRRQRKPVQKRMPPPLLTMQDKHSLAAEKKNDSGNPHPVFAVSLAAPPPVVLPVEPRLLMPEEGLRQELPCTCHVVDKRPALVLDPLPDHGIEVIHVTPRQSFPEIPVIDLIEDEEEAPVDRNQDYQDQVQVEEQSRIVHGKEIAVDSQESEKSSNDVPNEEEEEEPLDEGSVEDADQSYLFLQGLEDLTCDPSDMDFYLCDF